MFCLFCLFKRSVIIVVPISHVSLRCRFFMAWLTGRKTPNYLLTYLLLLAITYLALKGAISMCALPSGFRNTFREINNKTNKYFYFGFTKNCFVEFTQFVTFSQSAHKACHVNFSNTLRGIKLDTQIYIISRVSLPLVCGTK